MRTVFIFHGTGGHPQENWFPWLKKELEEKGYQVIIPQFPTPEGQSVESWMKVLNQYKDSITESTIFIGHSLGGLFLLRVLEQLNHPIHVALVVAGPVGIRPIKFYNGDSQFSNGFDFDWEKIKQNAKHFVVYHSDNDPYISLGNGEEIAKKLNVKLTFIPHAGHFNTASGYRKFENLRDTLTSFG